VGIARSEAAEWGVGGGAMVGVLVTFAYPSDVDRERIAGIATHARDTFVGMPGLRSKTFTIDEAGRRAINFYVWDDEDAARAFFNDALVERITGLYGTKPTVDFVEIAALVENAVSV
jgi:heme-degrading monooxygenase HmoA